VAMIFIDGVAISRGLHALTCAVVFMAMMVLQGCAGGAQTASVGAAQSAVTSIPADFFIPKGFFAQRSKGAALMSEPARFIGARSPTSGSVLPLVPEVLLYASETTSSFLSSGGLDFRASIRVWEVFLRKYKIPFRVIVSVEQLEKTQPGVLLLPSSVALSDREKRAVAGFRDKGGSVLASWLTGVRDERAAWKGFGFMEEVLNVKVAGNTKADEDDNFMIVHGDNPIAHSLPAGLRVWLERVDEFYPLRFEGGHAAANIMDWSRTFVSGKPTAVIVFDERRQSSGLLSRSVVLGYPERVWLSADPKSMEAIAHNALMWLLRQPDAYLAAWPSPYGSAFVMAVDVVDVFVDGDVSFSKMLEAAGGRATYYLLGDIAVKSLEMLNKVVNKGHEFGYLSDRFEGFRNQPANTQTRRLDAMRKSIADAGIKMPLEAGFRPPMESYDKTTEALVKDRAFGHFVSFMDATDTRLPFLMKRGPGGGDAESSLVVLPRTQTGPEEWMEEGDPDEGLKFFLEELNLAEQMAGLSFVRVPSQSLMSSEQLEVLFSSLKNRSPRMWLSTASQVSQWWRERDAISARMEIGPSGPVLVVNQSGIKPLTQSAAVWVNLPKSGSVLRLIDAGASKISPKLGSVDAWRVSVLLEGLAPGEHRWSVRFD
jgi:hypothetical protein